MESLYQPAASLLKATADTNNDIANRDSAEAMAIMKSAQSQASDREQQQGAMDRQKVAGEQNIQQILETAKQNALAEKEKFERDHSFVIDDNMASGLVKATGNDGFKSMIGQRIDAKEAMAMATGMIKAKYRKPQLTDVDLGNGNGPQKVEIEQVEDEQGNTTYKVTPVGKSIPRGKGSGKSPEEKAADDLMKLEKEIGGTNKTLLAEIKRGNIPEEAWGGEPGNVRKLQQFISAGNMGNLDDTQKARVSAIGGLITKMSEQNTRANEIRKGMGKEAVDYTGGLGASSNDDAKLLEFMKTNKVKDTPANREWAKKKIAGNA